MVKRKRKPSAQATLLEPQPDVPRTRQKLPFSPPERFVRPLRVFAFDPSRGNRTGNVMTIRLPYEPLQRGPIGQRVAVVDYDGSRDRFYPPVDLDHPSLLEGGLEPRDSDPRFHQQMVYAVVSQTLRTFDRALGRAVRFRFERQGNTDTRDRRRLRVYPHGVNEANAFYSRELRGLVFGYFAASPDDPGPNIPGQPIFTCLSHDIIVHEACHAIIDGMREYFLEPTNRDTLAFHEGLSDIIAMLQHFTFPEPLLDTIQRTGGRLYLTNLQPELLTDTAGRELVSGAIERNPLVDLALQFGESLGTRRALRTAIAQEPNTRDILKLDEPHARGGILVAALFEAFFRVYARRTRDLFRLAGITVNTGSEIHPDLAQRLCGEATSVADQFVQLSIRAIEYCPPVDLEFGDFLRAMITVHSRLDEDDRDGYREALIQAFARRGIYPPDVRSLTESELTWQPPASSIRVPDELMAALRVGDRGDRVNQGKIAELLNGFCDKNRPALGLAPDAKIAVRSFHHAVRLLGAELEVAQDFVCEVIQQREVAVAPGSRITTRVRGGTTIVLRNDGRVRYAIAKELDKRRSQAQIDYATGREVSSAALYVMGAAGTDLRALHRGY